MKEFKIIEGKNEVYFDSIVKACKEANKIGSLVYVLDLKTGEVKEIINKNTIEYLISK